MKKEMIKYKDAAENKIINILSPSNLTACINLYLFNIGA